MLQKLPNSTDLPEKFVIVGQIGAPYGVQGWNHVSSFTEPLENLLLYKNWHIQQHDQWIPLALLGGRVHGAGLVAKLQGVSDRDQASQLSQKKVGIRREQFANLATDEYYWTDLEGLLVQTQSGDKLGYVDYLYKNAELDVMVIRDSQQQIPFIMNDTILAVDLVNQQIIVDWPAA